MRVSPELLMDVLKLQGPAADSVDGIPQDARIVGCWWSEEARTICISIESDSFAPLNPGDRMPEMTVQYHKSK